MRAAALLLGLACFGCRHTAIWSYTPEPPKTRAPLIARSVAVPPAIDQRAGDNIDEVDAGIVPLVPYGWYEYPRPETRYLAHPTTEEWQFRPAEDIALAVAAELQASGLFREAFFAVPAPKDALVLSVTIESTLGEGKLISYGVSFGVIPLWLIGLPRGTMKSELKLAFELKEQATGRILWSARCERFIDEGCYRMYAQPSDFTYDTMLKDMLVNEVLPALESLPPEP